MRIYPSLQVLIIFNIATKCEMLRERKTDLAPQRRSGSGFAFSQSDQGIPYSLADSMYTALTIYIDYRSRH